jgi:two-component system, NtrC family, C4-dicarboxylate transport sensor histidine kinase DctB
METVAKMVSSANRYDYSLSVIMIDVDHFKRINDVYGHPAGDKVLQAMVMLCTEELREGDIFARFGGEEFIIALPHADKQAAQLVAERIRTTVMNRPIEAGTESLHITISCGISQHRSGELDIEGTVKRADQALYEAKNSGRNRVVIA